MNLTSRRNFLRGAGATLAIPLLASARPRAAGGEAVVEPLRTVFWYVPCGIQTEFFEPTVLGTKYDLKAITEPLRPVQADVSLIGGLANYAAEETFSGDHARGTASFLTVTRIRHTAGADIENGISVDQLIAQHYAGETPLPSLQLGIAAGGNTGDCTAGYSCAYTRNIAWAGPATPLPNVTAPGVAFDRLFGVDASLSPEERLRRSLIQASVLDRVREDATRLQSRLGRDDQLKLDEYLTAVREVELRVQGLGGVGSCVAPDRPQSGVPLAEHVAIMNELMALALQCDITRVATFMLGMGGSNQTYPFLGVAEAHHQLSHHQGDPTTLEKLATIANWEVAQFADLVARLGAIPSADGLRLLDHSLLMLSSEIRDGDLHDHRNLPILLAGGGGGAHVPGRYWREAEGRSIADLFLSMMYAADMEQEVFGIDGTEPMNLQG